ncbi:MAG: helix-turn-helix transcriptional regulator [Chitinophagaceae bacterium]|nr:helix-turn-helix transcriptional regulator [Chitinophagaceae bacterium]
MKSKIDIYVIDKVREMRIAHNMSQEELSIKAGFRSNGFVGQAESFKYNKRYNIQHLNSFARIFNCSPKDLLPDTPV